MTKASDNEFPSLLVKEGTAPSSPASGDQRVFIDSSDHLLKVKNSSGTVTTVGSGMTNPMTTSQDIIVGGSSGTPGRLAKGADGTFLGVVSGSLAYATPAGGGATIARPSLTPGSPTDDFTAALSGWTAVSTNGSFSTSTCLAQTIDGSHLMMAWGGQNGFIYKSASNVDQEWWVGGLTTSARITGSDMFFGIALLDTSNNGMGLIYHTSDNSCALIQIAAGIYDGSHATTTSTLWGSYIGTPTKMWFRLTRSTNTWQGYVSIDGVNWTQSTSTLSDTITVARKAIGSFGNAASAYNGQLYADWVTTV